MALRDQFKYGDVVHILNAPKGINTGTVVSVGIKYVQVERINGPFNTPWIRGFQAKELRKITT